MSSAIDHWPHVHPDARTIGDAELLILGALPDAPLSVEVPADVADRVAVRGGVLIVDEEGAPVAALPAPEREPFGDGLVRLTGLPEAVGHVATGAFRHLSLAPAELEVPQGERMAVLLDRPLLAPEVAALAEVGVGAEVLLLVRTLDAQLPADVLLRATLAAAEQVLAAQVVAVPFARRETDALDSAAAAAIVEAYGAAQVDVLEPAEAWDDVRAALDVDDEATLAEALDPASLAVLRQWRPRRSRRGLTVFFTGLSGSGKSTVARALIDRLHETERTITVLDGDAARRMLSAGLSFSRADRDLNIRRIGWVAAEVTRHGGVAVCAPIAPFAETRAEVRRMVQATGDLVLVWVSTPLQECERRDRKGLYAKARRGEIPDFTGISSPYEEPEDADVVIDTTDVSITEAVDVVWRYLHDGGWLT